MRMNAGATDYRGFFLWTLIDAGLQRSEKSEGRADCEKEGRSQI